MFLARNKPAKSLNRVAFKSAKGARRILSNIRTTLRNKGYRKDLKMAALRRASALLAGQKPKVAKAQAKKADK